MAKRELYGVFIERMNSGLERGVHLESAWLAYSVLEDRLRSLLMNSKGGAPSDKKGNPRVRMTLGEKLAVLKTRMASDPLLAAYLPYADLHAWKTLRDQLMHSMADGTSTIAQIDRDAGKLALDGARLVRDLTAVAARLKKHRKKVPV